MSEDKPSYGMLVGKASIIIPQLVAFLENKNTRGFKDTWIRQAKDWIKEAKKLEQ